MNVQRVITPSAIWPSHNYPTIWGQLVLEWVHWYAEVKSPRLHGHKSLVICGFNSHDFPNCKNTVRYRFELCAVESEQGA